MDQQDLSGEFVPPPSNSTSIEQPLSPPVSQRESTDSSATITTLAPITPGAPMGLSAAISSSNIITLPTSISPTLPTTSSASRPSAASAIQRAHPHIMTNTPRISNSITATSCLTPPPRERQPLQTLSTAEPTPLRRKPRKSQDDSNTPSPKKRRSNNEDDNNNSKILNNSNILNGSVYFLLAGGGTLKMLGSVWLKKFLLSCKDCEDFEMPEPDQFDSIVNKACEEKYNQYVSQGFYKFLLVYTKSECDHLFAISFAVTRQYNELVYIKDAKIFKDENQKENFKSFCSDSVQNFHISYNYIAKYLLYNGDITLEDTGSGLATKFFQVPCLSRALTKLRCRHDGWSVSSEDPQGDCETIVEFNKKVDDLKRDIEVSRCNLGEGTQRILEFVDEHRRVLNIQPLLVIKKYLRPVMLGCNFFDPRFKGHQFEDDVDLVQLLDEFLESHCPIEEFSAIRQYGLNTHHFYEKSRYIQEPKRFWTILKQHHEKLAQFCLDLIAVPAIMPRVDIERIIEESTKFSDEGKTKLISMSLIANDVCL